MFTKRWACIRAPTAVLRPSHPCESVSIRVFLCIVPVQISPSFFALLVFFVANFGVRVETANGADGAKVPVRLRKRRGAALPAAVQNVWCRLGRAGGSTIQDDGLERPGVE